MKFVVATMVLIIGAGLAQAQQLPWTPSLRNPYTAPATFVGIDASVGYSMHSASLPYLDEIYSIPCCTYEQGSGAPLGLAAVVETWVMPSIAASASFGITSESVVFTTNPITIPRVGKPDLQTRYILEHQQSWVSLALGSRMRLSRSPLTIGLKLSANVLIGSASKHKEEVVGPEDYYFLTDPPSKEYVLPETRLADVASLVLRPAIVVSYDMPLTYGYYLSPQLRIERTLGSLSRQHTWSATTISLGLTLYKGL
jgi:hypothetical protein